MRTSKEFSTVAYNKSLDLQAKLQDLVDRRKIDFYIFIQHKAEDDDLKEHIHLLIIPNGIIDTDTVREYLRGMDEDGKPTEPLPCRSSKFGDWFLYASHNPVYLANKLETRRYHYTKEQFVISDTTYFNELFNTIDWSKYDRDRLIAESIQKGQATPQTLLRDGIIGIRNFYAWSMYYNSIDILNTDGEIVKQQKNKH